MSVSTTFDLLLRGGRVIDPASGIDGIKDVAIRSGKVAAVQSDILPTSAREVLDVTDKIVLPGLSFRPANRPPIITACAPAARALVKSPE